MDKAVEKSNFFVVSGFISIFIYLLLCFLVFYYLITPKPKTYSFQSKATVLELDVIVEKSDKKRVEKKVEKVIEKKEEVTKEASISAEKKPDLKSLFGNVKTSETKVADKEVNNVIKSIDPKRFKAKFEKEKKSSNVKIDSLLTDTKTTTSTKNQNLSMGEESDEYYSQVQDLLNQFTPTTRLKDLKAVVVISISPSGVFDYSFTSYSGNTNFDYSLKAFLDEQKSIIYPIPKKNRTVKISVDFKSEE